MTNAFITAVKELNYDENEIDKINRYIKEHAGFALGYDVNCFPSTKNYIDEFAKQNEVIQFSTIRG